MSTRKIGPYLEVTEPYTPRMQDAYESDFEEGSHHLNNISADECCRKYPTIMAMASEIEKQRDELFEALYDVNEQLKLLHKQINDLFDKMEPHETSTDKDK